MVVSSLCDAVVKRAALVRAALDTSAVVVRRRAVHSVALIDVVSDTVAAHDGLRPQCLPPHVFKHVHTADTSDTTAAQRTSITRRD